MERKRQSLEVEVKALSKESDKTSKARLAEAQQELSQTVAKLTPLRERYDMERGMSEELQNARQRLQAMKQKLEVLEARHDLDAVADLRFDAIPGLLQRIRNLEREKASYEASGQGPMLVETVTPDHIGEVVARWTGIPVAKLSQGERARLLALKGELKRRVIGQEEAAEAVSRAVLRSAARLSSRQKPTGSFLFAGPTGVGKTELAKALANELFDSESRLLRFDMSEYMEQHAVARFIGAPPGYVGHDEGGQLTEAVRRNPYSVVLFDEMEKAHPQVLNVLLQLLDEGRITDSKGRTVDCSNCVIILTSNIGAEHLLRAAHNGGTHEMRSGKEQTLAAVRHALRPELLNRLDNIIVFEPLSRHALRQVVRLQLAEVLGRLEELDIELDLSDAAVDHVLAEAYDHELGARPLKRYLEWHLVSELSELILKDEIGSGCAVTVDCANGQWAFRVRKATAGGRKGGVGISRNNIDHPSMDSERMPASGVINDGPSSSLTIGEMRRRLQILGVSHSHCLERSELEELLACHDAEGGSLDGKPSVGLGRARSKSVRRVAPSEALPRTVTRAGA